MTNVQSSKDCGNSPKNLLLQELTIAVARARTDRISKLLTGNVEWHAVGNQPILGREHVINALTRRGPASALTIDHVVSHGRAGAVDGVVTFGKKKRGFCHVFEFSGAKGAQVSRIVSYSLPLR